MRYRLGVDVGGTFTDILLIDSESGTSYRAKTPSTPHDQSVGVINGIEKACAAAATTLAEVDQVLHGTTVATNAILEGKGAKVGLVTTAGFRQVLQYLGYAGWPEQVFYGGSLVAAVTLSHLAGHRRLPSFA